MKLAVVTPVFNDWESFARLSHEICQVMESLNADYEIIAVNDDSLTPPDPSGFASHCSVVNLTCNVGHQRAIAIGLSWLADNVECDAAIVMDSDGEDKPEDIPGLVQQAQDNPAAIVVARRDKRSEGAAFRAGYQLYQWLFYLFTGKRLSFGNFCLLPASVLRRLIYRESLWNHLAATVLRSGLPLAYLSTARGRRYAGESRMNPGNLVLLGFSAISVYSDMALLRVLIVTLLFSLVAVGGIAVTLFIKFFTGLAIPGWASSVVGSMAIIIVQCLVVSVSLLFVVLSSRSQGGFVVARRYNEYLLTVERLGIDSAA